MNKKFFIPALIAAIFAASVPAVAQDRVVRERGADGRQDGYRGDDNRRGDYRGSDGRRDEGWRGDARRGDVRRGDARRDNDRRGDYRRDDHRRGDQARYEDRRYRGAGPNHDLRRGTRLPSHYHHRQYVVDNWRSHRLSAPPRGYHWVQAGDDYVLAAIATGLIAQILLNN